MFKVNGGVQNYAWGRKGSSSLVSIFTSPISEDLPYAEYWLGTHPSLPTSFNSFPLSQTTGELPYLFKILSIAKPLSIQVHPSKPQAFQLHHLSPSLYPDSNHKPEMCIALTPFKLLLGFKPPSEIQQMLESTPELLSIVGIHDLRTQLHSLYISEELTQNSVRNYCDRVNQGVYYDINLHFPGDSGVFFAMFMNYVELDRGEAVVISAGVPHCYLEGECIEAMACSDNVVRAGLTPKVKDVKTLLDIIEITQGRPEIFKGEEAGEGFIRYSSGFEEFEVICYRGGDFWLREIGFPALGFVVDGECSVGESKVSKGECIMVTGSVEVKAEMIEMYLCYEKRKL